MISIEEININHGIFISIISVRFLSFETIDLIVCFLEQVFMMKIQKLLHLVDRIFVRIHRKRTYLFKKKDSVSQFNPSKVHKIFGLSISILLNVRIVMI